jgi:hypothetical protein
MSRMSPIVCCVLILVLLKPASAFAQGAGATDPRLPDPRVQVLGERLAGERAARVHTQWGRIELTDPQLRGTEAIDYRRARLYGLYDVPEGFPTPLPLREVAALQVQRSAVRPGALIGGAAVGGMGMLAGLTATRSCDSPNAILVGCGYTAADVARTTLASAASGAVLGAIYGTQLRHWRTVYRAGR